MRDISIRSKLTLLLSGTVGGALLLACAALVIHDLRMIESSIHKHLAALADVMGANCTAALDFQVPSTAEELLRSLRREPSIVLARVHDARGEVFAQFVAPGAHYVLPPPLHPNDTVFVQNGYLHVFKPIRQDQEDIGTVYLQASRAEIHAQWRAYAWIVTILLIVSLVTVIALSSQLQGLISRPILRLVEAAEHVAAQSDFSIRVTKESRDELGVLCDAFNLMLGQIQQRDVELERHRLHLEELVRERTELLQAETDALERSEEQLSLALQSTRQNELAVKQQAHELARLNTELQRSNLELEQFAYIASHDLQEPLRKVQAFSDLLSSQFGDLLGDEGRDYLARMQNATIRMKSLITELLNYSRVTRKGQPYTRVDLNQVTQEVLSDLEARIRETRGRVEVGPLPVLEADAMQMRQLLQNLIGNGLKYHRAEEPRVVLVEATVVENQEEKDDGPGQPVVHSTAGGSCRLTVQDHGIGFDEKYLDRIFAPFQRLHGRGEYEGTGMGLAVCRKIVERHGGSITARTAPGQGATFIVVLPLQQPAGA